MSNLPLSAHLSAIAAAAGVALASMSAMAAAPAAAPVPVSRQILPVPLNPVIPADQRKCDAVTATGLGTLNLRPAEGAKPAKSDYVLVGYIGYLAADGQVFDQNPGTAFPADGVIPGFSEGLQMMTKGSVWRFCVPAAIGYGAQAAGSIPPGSDLVFQVELLDFKTAAEIQAMQKQAQEAAPAASAPRP